MEKNQIFENIMSRTSVRSYTDMPVEPEKVEMMLRAGMAAPSACNKQPWHFVVINDREILDQIPQFSPYAGMVKQAPLAIVVCGCLDKTLEGTEQEFWIQDCSAATENILLMAHGLGLGGVWTALYPLKERYEGMQQLLHLPKTMIPLNTLIMDIRRIWRKQRISGKRRMYPIINGWRKIHNTRKKAEKSYKKLRF